MKTNLMTITRPLATAALLLTIVTNLSSCNSDEPIKPQSVYGPVLPAVAPDTLTIDPVTDPPVTVREPDVLVPYR